MKGIVLTPPHKSALKFFVARNNAKCDQLILARFQNCKFMKKKTVDQFRNNNSSTQHTPPPAPSNRPWNLIYQKKLQFVSFCQFYCEKKRF